MKKIFSFLLLFMLLFAPLPVSAGETAPNKPEEEISDAAKIFTITLTLLDLAAREDNISLLTVKLPEGETMILEAMEHCGFIDNRKQPLSPSDFAKRYKGEKVTIDFTERGPGLYLVMECRAGTQ